MVSIKSYLGACRCKNRKTFQIFLLKLQKLCTKSLYKDIEYQESLGYTSFLLCLSSSDVYI
jgi:hypothetical protein